MKRMAWVLVGCLALCAGCGRESVSDKARRATNKAGQVVGEGASSFFTGVGEGVDKTIASYDIRLARGVKELGLSVTIAKRAEVASGAQGQGLSFYLLSERPAHGVLQLRLYNDKDQEIGRSEAPFDFAADDARYVTFALDKEVPMAMTRYVTLDLDQE